MFPVKVFFDLETTGLGSTAKIVQFGAVLEFPDDKDKDVPLRTREFCSLIDPAPKKMQSTATKVTGITNDMLRGAPKFERVWASFCVFLERHISCRLPCHNCACSLTWIGYNNDKFDNVVLARELRSANLTWAWKSEIRILHYTADLMKAIKLCKSYTLSECANYKLKTVYEYLFKQEMRNAHDALGDVRATRLIYLRNPNISGYLDRSKSISQILRN
jgi:DNA polymerase III epsilon subunit-like protein